MIHTKGKIVQAGNSLSLIIPKVIVQNYNLKKGMELKIGLHDDGLIIPINLQELDYEIKIEKKESGNRSAITVP